MFPKCSSLAKRSHERKVFLSFYDPWWGYRPFGYSHFRYYNQYVFSSSEKAYNQGYHDGSKTGESDRKHDRGYDPERSHYFRTLVLVTSRSLIVMELCEAMLMGSARKE